MAMKKISDIRLFRSARANAPGTFPKGFDCPLLIDYATRLAVRLRQLGFMLDGFDMIYVDFNCSLPDGMFEKASRPVDKLFPGYRFYEVAVPKPLYEKLDSDKMLYPVLNYLRLLLKKCFLYGTNTEEMITRAIYETAKFGEDLFLDYKIKSNGDYEVKISYHYTNTGRTLPVAEITRLADGKKKKCDLPETDDIEQLTEIRINKKSVVVKFGREGGYAGERDFTIDLSEM